MRRNHLACVLAVLAIGGSGGVAVTGALMGPPAICVPLDIGDAKSVPVGSGAMDLDTGYDAKHIVGDTMKVLRSTRDPLVHMETLRRASLYAAKDDGARANLLVRMMGFALDEEASGKVEELAWLDVGYFIVCMSQFDADADVKYGRDESHVSGYTYLKKALAIAERGGSKDAVGAIQLACANATIPAMRNEKGQDEAKIDAQYLAHIDGASAAASKGSLLAKNIAGHKERFASMIERYRK